MLDYIVSLETSIANSIGTSFVWGRNLGLLSRDNLHVPGELFMG